MIRRLSYMANKERIQDIRRRITQKRDIFRTRAVNFKSKAQSSSFYTKLKKYWRYTPIPISLYLLYQFVNNNYSSKWRCIKKLDSIYNESNRDRLRINMNYTFFEYFFPVEPLAIIYPQSQQQLQKVVQVCGQYNVGLFVSSSNEFTEPINLEEHKHYLIVNPVLLKKFSIDSQNHTMKISSGYKCSEINQILKNQGYSQIFDQQLEDKYLFEVINYNLPLGTRNLASILINLQLISGNGKLFQSGPDIQHFGPNVRYNDLFLGSKGIFGIPLQALIRLSHPQKSSQTKVVEIDIKNPNDKILLVREIIKKISPLNIKMKVYYQSGKVFLKFINFGSICLQQLLQKYPLKPTKEEHKPVQYSAIFNIPLTFLYQMIVRQQYSNITFEFENGLIKLYAPESLIKQINNQITIQNGLLIWIKDHVMFEELKKQNAGIQLGQNLIYENINLRQFFDPKHTLLSTKSYLKFVKPPRRYTFRNMVSDFW